MPEDNPVCSTMQLTNVSSAAAAFPCNELHCANANVLTLPAQAERQSQILDLHLKSVNILHALSNELFTALSAENTTKLYAGGNQNCIQGAVLLSI